MSLIVSHWMPDVAPNVLNPSTSALQTIGVVKGRFHQVLDHETYLSLLAERLTILLQAEPNPEDAARSLVEELEEKLDLPPIYSDQSDASEWARVIVNALDPYLRRLGIPGKLPERMPPNVIAAQRVYDQTTLESWTSSLLNHPANPDR